MRDEKIIDLYWERNERAITQTEEKYGRYLTKIAYNILADEEDSKESVNDTYLAAWNSMPPQRPTALSAYLGKITRQISIDIFRKRNREKRRLSEFAVSYDEISEVLSAGDMTEEQVQAKLLGEAINKFLQGQPKEVRNLFIGRYYFLDPLKEAAKYCGMSEGKAKSVLFRTRSLLKEYLQKEGFDI